MTREPSVDEIVRRAEPVLQAAEVQAAYLFGSRAQGTARASSDVDVAVLAGRHVGLLEEQDLAARLADRLGVDDVDVVVLDRAELSLRGAVVQEGRLVYAGDEPARVAFEVRTRSEYFDYLPTLEAHRRRFLQQVAEEGL